MGAEEVQDFLSHLAVERNVAGFDPEPSQVCAAILVTAMCCISSCPWLDEVIVARHPSGFAGGVDSDGKLPPFAECDVPARWGWLQACFTARGMRLGKACGFRVKGVEFERREIIVRGGQGWNVRAGLTYVSNDGSTF